MTKLIFTTARVAIFTATIFFAATTTSADQSKHVRLPDSEIISNIISKYVGPLVKSFQVGVEDPKDIKTDEDSAVKKAIEKKINKLKPILDVNSQKDTIGDVSEEKTEETTIIEFSPFPEASKNILRDQQSIPEPIKEHVKKYKKLQNEVEEVLVKEHISNKAKTVVTKTLNELIDQLLSTQCTWRNRAEKTKDFRSKGKLLKIDRNSMIESWKNKWEELIDRYSLGTRNTDADGSDYKEVFLFLLRLREFFFEIHDELNTFNDKYKVKCQVVDKDTANSNPKKFKIITEREGLRQRPKSTTSENSCGYVTICTGELKSFLMDFYINIKETVDIVFKNYEEMYKRDVNTASSQEKHSFVALMKKINKAVDEKFRKTFKKEINKLVMDVSNSTQTKATAIKNYIKTTAERVQKLIDTILKEQLKTLGASLRLTVKQDITTTIGIEIDNLQNIFINKMCTVFQTCNGNISRRFNSDYTPVRKPFARNDIHVKLQLGFNGVESLRRSGNQFKMTRAENKHATGFNRYQTSKPKTSLDLERYLNFTVTRTTYYVQVRKGTTKIKINESPGRKFNTVNEETTVTETNDIAVTEKKVITIPEKNDIKNAHANHVKEEIALGNKTRNKNELGDLRSGSNYTHSLTAIPTINNVSDIAI